MVKGIINLGRFGMTYASSSPQSIYKLINNKQFLYSHPYFRHLQL